MSRPHGTAGGDAPTKRLAVLASGSGSNLQALVDACGDGRLDAEVAVVVCDRPGARALLRADAAGISAETVALESGELRPDYDRRLAEVVSRYRPDVVVLAGWMRLLTMNFLGDFPGRVVNLHPALPGQLPGTNAVERAFREYCAGDRTATGVMVHLVPDEGVDDGPVLATATVAIQPDDTLESLIARVHATEHALLVDAIGAFAPNELSAPART